MMRLALLLVELMLAIGIPALIALRFPRRWRLWAVAFWAVLPLLLLLAIVGSEIASGKASAVDLDKLIYGLLLIGSFLALPWLMACGVGYAIGALVRRRGQPDAGAAVRAAPVRETISAPISYLSRPATPGTPSLSPAGGWHAAHVGFDHDDFMLDGLPVWSLSWREESAAPVMLAHPAHPAQQHAFRIYAIDDGVRATRFAAAELSNGVWGFYRWVVPADAAAGTSADGSLRYEHDLGPHEGSHHDAPVARLYDVRTGRLLFDGAAWGASRIVPQADGHMLLALDHGERQTIFRIDPAADTFGNLALAGEARPLAELAEAAAGARAEAGDPANTYLGRRIAPDGSLLVELQAVEWSNSHWVRSPRVIEIATGRVVLDLWGTDWDAVVTFPRARTAHLAFRRYHFGGEAEVEIDLGSDAFLLLDRSGTSEGVLADLADALEESTRRTATGSRAVIAKSPPTARNWLVALLILIGTLALIAAATALTLHFKGETAPQRLDVIPPMPKGP